MHCTINTYKWPNIRSLITNKFTFTKALTKFRISMKPSYIWKRNCASFINTYSAQCAIYVQRFLRSVRNLCSVHFTKPFRIQFKVINLKPWKSQVQLETRFFVSFLRLLFWEIKLIISILQSCKILMYPTYQLCSVIKRLISI